MTATIKIQMTRTNKSNKIASYVLELTAKEYSGMFSAAERKRLNNGVTICTCSHPARHVTAAKL